MNPDGASRILFSREGEFTPALEEALFSELRLAVESGALPKNAVRIAIELVQNLRLHGGGGGHFTIRSDAASLILESANPLPQAAAEELVARIRALPRGSDAAQAARKRRRETLPPGAKGAGLGLLEIAHLAGEMEAVAQPLSGGNSLLVIRAILQHKFTS
jgi:hypothetical protein